MNDKFLLAGFFGLVAIFLIYEAYTGNARIGLFSSWPRLIYSSLLIVGALLLVREISNVWRTPPLTIGTFELSSDGKADTTRSTALRAMILERHVQINNAFRRENANRAAEILRNSGQEGRETVPLPFTEASLGFTRDQLDEIELKVQDINFGKIFASLRRSVSPPNEVTGHVVAPPRENSITAVVRWPGAPELAASRFESNKLMTFEDIGRDSDLAAKVACALIWARLAADKDSTVSGLTREQFCLWTEAFLIRQVLEERHNAGLELTGKHLEALESARQKIELLVGQKAPYPEVYLTRAKLALLQPGRSANDIAIAAQGREIYAALVIDKKPLEDLQIASRSVVGAPLQTTTPTTATGSLTNIPTMKPPAKLQRPSVPVDLSAEAALTAEVRSTFTGLDQTSQKVAQSTGFLFTTDGNEPYMSSGFVVAPEVVAVADFAFPKNGLNKVPRYWFSTALQAPATEADSFPVAAILMRDPQLQIALLHVPGLEAAGILPVDLSEQDVVVPGAPMAVIGYPVAGRGTPEMEMLLRGRPYVKRVMPGLFTGDPSLISSRPDDVGHDAATAGGVAGGPVIDLGSGTVVGLHLGGTYVDENQKRNYAVRVDREMIARALEASGI